MRRILITLTLILFSILGISQGGPPSWPPGNGNGGPPFPCPPNDPACPQVPLSDWYWEIGLMVVGGIFVYFKYFKLKTSSYEN
jgi:hypothetical protein